MNRPYGGKKPIGGDNKPDPGVGPGGSSGGLNDTKPDQGRKPCGG